MTSHMLLLTYDLHLIPSHFFTHVIGHHWHSFGKPLAKVLTWIFWGVFHCHLGGQVSSVLHQENLQKNGHCGGVVTEYLAHFLIWFQFLFSCYCTSVQLDTFFFMCCFTEFLLWFCSRVELIGFRFDYLLTPHGFKYSCGQVLPVDSLGYSQNNYRSKWVLQQVSASECILVFWGPTNQGWYMPEMSHTLLVFISSSWAALRCVVAPVLGGYIDFWTYQLVLVLFHFLNFHTSLMLALDRLKKFIRH